MSTATTTRDLRCVVVTPEKAVVDEKADFVALPLYDGEIGFLPGRAPLVGRLGCGELRIRQGKETKRYYVEGGFVQARKNVVTVLTSRATKAEDLTPEQVAQAMEKARKVPDGEQRLRDEERARAMERVASHASDDKATR
jgi:F-type H+-transporting ATPase subunit epsilon